MSRTTSTVMSGYSASNAALRLLPWSNDCDVYSVTLPSSLAAVTMASHSSDDMPAGAVPVGGVVWRGGCGGAAGGARHENR